VYKTLKDYIIIAHMYISFLKILNKFSKYIP